MKRAYAEGILERPKEDNIIQLNPNIFKYSWKQQPKEK
jgi:hypothetical protein